MHITCELPPAFAGGFLPRTLKSLTSLLSERCTLGGLEGFTAPPVKQDIPARPAPPTGVRFSEVFPKRWVQRSDAGGRFCPRGYKPSASSSGMKKVCLKCIAIHPRPYRRGLRIKKLHICWSRNLVREDIRGIAVVRGGMVVERIPVPELLSERSRITIFH